MKILMINSVCGIRSTGRICTDIAGILDNNGHECKIAYGRHNCPQGYEKYAVRIGNETDVKYHALKTRLFDGMGFGSKRATEEFIEWVKEYNPDVVHLHNIHGYYINIEVLFEYLSKFQKPVIWTLHDCWPFTGHCAHFCYAKCERWKDKACGHCPQKTSYPSSYFIDASKRNYNIKKELFTSVADMKIVTPSRWLADLVKESFLGTYPVEVIPNGVDLDVFKPTDSDFREKYGLQDKKVVLGVASAWNERKGLLDFIRLSEMLDESYQVVLVGLTKKQKHELPESIIGLTGTNNTGELAGLYTTADVFVNLTYEDNYPTTNLEAQACGTPVITYKTGGSVESADENSIVAQGDLSALCQKIVEGSSKVKENLLLDKKETLVKYMDIYSPAKK